MQYTLKTEKLTVFLRTYHYFETEYSVISL